MYFSRAKLQQDMSTAALIGQLMSGNSYAAHQMLWRLFPDDPDAPRDFIFRQELKNGWPIFYLVSKRKPLKTDLFSEVVCKEYNPVLREGEQLSFTLRANPVVARKKEGRKHSVKHDVWMDSKRAGRIQDLEGVKLQSFVTEQVKRWLLLRGKEKGFSAQPEDIELQGYQQHQVYKKKVGKPIKYSSVDFQGVMTVDDTDIMKKALFDGIGKAKGFGCGLMLIRRI